MSKSICDSRFHIEECQTLLRNLSRIDFKPSCLDFGWGWKVQPVLDEIGDHIGFLIYSGFERPDTHTGVVSTGWGRAWFISLGYRQNDCKELVMTAWMAIGQIVEHERLEAFSYDGARLFDPHKSLDDLAHPEKFKKPEVTGHWKLGKWVPTERVK